MKRTYLLLFLLLLTVYFSCKHQELPVEKHNPGSLITASVNMESNYKWQIFYNLKKNVVVSQNLKTSWDLGFETNAEGFRIILNTSKAMFALNTGIQDFSTVSDTNGFFNNRTWDYPSGSMDSTAIGDWRNSNTVYLIDRGYNENGLPLGFKKVVFLNVTETQYTVRFSNLDGTNDVTRTITKDPRYNFVFLLLNETGEVPIVEPPKDAWDICFTQYLHIFYDPYQPYLVTGCLHNRYNTLAAADSVLPFSGITIADTGKFNLSPNINAIGYEWKKFDGNIYITSSYINYLIKNSDGYFYKLRFINFYDESGTKGNPVWEFQDL